MKTFIFKFTKIFSLLLVISLAFVLVGCKEPEIEEPEIKEINTNYTDELELKAAYANKSFINDGIGEVRLSQNVDGDTAMGQMLQYGSTVSKEFAQAYLINKKVIKV